MGTVDYSAFPKICKARAPFRKRWPDMVIGDNDNPYLLRWYVIPRNRIFNIYLHKFVRSDDDRALHDHPWSWNMSLIIKGIYIEHIPKNPETFGKISYKPFEMSAGAVNYMTEEEMRRLTNPPLIYGGRDMETVRISRRAWRPIFRKGTTPHRVELHKRHEDFIPRLGAYFVKEMPVWTIFITGKNVRDWGFYCPNGWRFWKEFVSVREGGNDVGRGCE